MQINADLLSAARRLQNSDVAVREAAEAELIKARHASVAALVAVVADPQGGSIARHALLLSALGDHDAVPALLLRLNERGDERLVVARAIVELLDGRDAFDDRVTEALDAMSADVDAPLRLCAVRGFLAIKDARSQARLLAMSKDTDVHVRERASLAVTTLREETAAAHNASNDLASFAALVADAEGQGGPYRPFLQDLADIRRPVREAAIVELVRAGKAATPHVIDALASPHTRARIAAATVLSRVPSADAQGPLLVAATTPAQNAEDAELRAIALRALANCLTGLEEGLSAAILPLANESDRFVRAGALLCLGRLADRRGLVSIVRGLLEDDAFVVEAAAVALSEGVREDDLHLVKPLLQGLGKRPVPSAAVREAILIALSRIDITAPALLVRVRHAVRKELLMPTKSTKKAAIVLLERCFSEQDPPPLTVQDDVVLALGDSHPEVRLVAASFLKTHLDPLLTGACPAIERAMLQPEVPLRLVLLDVLVRHGSEAARDVLARAQHLDAPIGTTAQQLLVDFVPKASVHPAAHKTNDLVPSALSPAQVAPNTQRASRVRPARANASDDVVTAKDPEP